MFAHRVQTTTTRANASFRSNFANRNQWRTIYISSPRHRFPTNALVDQSMRKAPGSIAEIKEQQRLADKHGSRGTQKMSKDELPLPIMDVMLPDLQLLAKRLSSNQSPGFRKRRPIIVRVGVMVGNFRNALREWEEDAPREKLQGSLSKAAFCTRYAFQRGILAITRVFSPYLWYNFVVRSLGAVGRFASRTWRNHQNREYDWRTFLKWRRRLVQRIVDWLEEAPEVKKLNQNDKMNYAAMRLLAEKEKFPGYKFGGLVDRTSFRLRFKYAKEIEEEDKILRDLSSDSPPLKATLEAAATRYIEMNRAVASGDTARLNQFADRGYLKELERRASTVGRTQRGAVTEWQFHKFVRPPTCLSIRAHDFYSEFRKSLVIGDRLYVNMIVKFESIQSLKVTRKEGDEHIILKDVQKQHVTEYLILDVRTWIDNRSPKFVMEVYEDQPLVISSTGLTGNRTEEKKEDEKKKEETGDGLSQPATA